MNKLALSSRKTIVTIVSLISLRLDKNEIQSLVVLGVACGMTAPVPVLFVATRVAAPKERLKLQRRCFDFEQKEENREKRINASQLVI